MQAIKIIEKDGRINAVMAGNFFKVDDHIAHQFFDDLTAEKIIGA